MGSIVETGRVGLKLPFRWASRLFSASIGWVGTGLFFYIVTGLDMSRYGFRLFALVAVVTFAGVAVQAVMSWIPILGADARISGDRISWRTSRSSRIQAFLGAIGLLVFAGVAGFILREFVGERDWGRAAASAVYFAAMLWGAVMILINGLGATELLAIDRQGLEIPGVLERLAWSEVSLIAADHETGATAVRVSTHAGVPERFQHRDLISPDGVFLINLGQASVKAVDFLDEVAARAPGVSIRRPQPGDWPGGLGLRDEDPT